MQTDKTQAQAHDTQASTEQASAQAHDTRKFLDDYEQMAFTMQGLAGLNMLVCEMWAQSFLGKEDEDGKTKANEVLSSFFTTNRLCEMTRILHEINEDISVLYDKHGVDFWLHTPSSIRRKEKEQRERKARENEQ